VGQSLGKKGIVRKETMRQYSGGWGTVPKSGVSPQKETGAGGDIRLRWGETRDTRVPCYHKVVVDLKRYGGEENN